MVAALVGVPEAPTTTSTPRSLKISTAPPPMPPAMMTCTPLSARKFGRKPGLWPGFGTASADTILPFSAS